MKARKIEATDVVKMRRTYAYEDSSTFASIAGEYNLHRETVRRAVIGASHQHIPMSQTLKNAIERKMKKTKIGGKRVQRRKKRNVVPTPVNNNWFLVSPYGEVHEVPEQIAKFLSDLRRRG